MIGYIAGTLTTIAFAPQLIKALKTRSTKDISLLMLLCSTTGMIFWLFHGISINDLALIIANSISVTLTSILLFYKVKKDYFDIRRTNFSRIMSNEETNGL
ncbi:MAG: SemiSWEET transporter [Methanolobus sp.]|nr:SemiSWEET transporter [Methanolobus sp.]